MKPGAIARGLESVATYSDQTRPGAGLVMWSAESCSLFSPHRETISACNALQPSEELDDLKLPILLSSMGIFLFLFSAQLLETLISML